MDRRALLLAGVALACGAAPYAARAKDGESSGGNSGSGGSGSSGSGNSGSGRSGSDDSGGSSGSDDSGGSSGSDDSGSDDSGGDSGGGTRSGRDDDGRSDESLRRAAASAVDRGEIAPLSAIARVALAHTPGKIIAVKLRHRGDAYTYRIRILARNGRRRELLIDARSRAILGVK
jgi:hypothetical protein